MSKKKWYVVWKGREPGIYDNWPEAEAQVKGFPGAIHKSFESKAEAECALIESAVENLPKKKEKRVVNSNVGITVEPDDYVPGRKNVPRIEVALERFLEKIRKDKRYAKT